MLPALKAENPWLSEVNAQSLQQALQHLDVAYTRFFRGEAGFPNFKAKGKSTDSFTVPQWFEVDQEGNRIRLPKLGWVRAVIHRKFEGKAKSVTVSRHPSGNFFASVLVETLEEDIPTKPIDPNTTIGVDLGIKEFLVASDGRRFESGKPLKRRTSKVKFLQRRAAKLRERAKERAKKAGEKKAKYGSNYRKASQKLAREHERVANRRRDFLHKASDAIADESQVGTVCVEDLNVKGMMTNHCLAGAIQDQG